MNTWIRRVLKHWSWCVNNIFSGMYSCYLIKSVVADQELYTWFASAHFSITHYALPPGHCVSLTREIQPLQTVADLITDAVILTLLSTVENLAPVPDEDQTQVGRMWEIPSLLVVIAWLDLRMVLIKLAWIHVTVSSSYHLICGMIILTCSLVSTQALYFNVW